MLLEGVVLDVQGVDICDVYQVDMLVFLGGEFGFKGVVLVGVVEIFSVVLIGMMFSFDIVFMGGLDMVMLWQMGLFVMVVNFEVFGDRVGFDVVMVYYLNILCNLFVCVGCKVMVLGDCEWQVVVECFENGVVLDLVMLVGFDYWVIWLGIVMFDMQGYL